MNPEGMPFANPFERDILLPDGCKDITYFPTRRTHAEPEFRVRPLKNVESYLLGRLASGAHFAPLELSSMDSRVKVALERWSEDVRIFPMAPSLERERDIDEFFNARGISPFIDRLVGHPGRPNRVLGFDLKGDPKLITVLVMDLLSSVYGMEPDAEIELSYYPAQ